MKFQIPFILQIILVWNNPSAGYRNMTADHTLKYMKGNAENFMNFEPALKIFKRSPYYRSLDRHVDQNSDIHLMRSFSRYLRRNSNNYSKQNSDKFLKKGIDVTSFKELSLDFPETKVCTEDGSVCHFLTASIITKYSNGEKDDVKRNFPIKGYEVHSFSYSDCKEVTNTLLDLSDIKIKDNRFTIPGVLAFEGSVTALTKLMDPFELIISVNGRKLPLLNEKFCLHKDCQRSNMCVALSMQDICKNSEDFESHYVPCDCPVSEGEYDLSTFQYTITKNYLRTIKIEEGSYSGQLQLNSHGESSCIAFDFIIENLN